jgi:hypothetical protein
MLHMHFYICVHQRMSTYIHLSCMK